MDERGFWDVLDDYRISTDPVKSTTAKLWADVTDRRGWRQAADSFDDDVKVEILRVWEAIIREQLK